MPFPQNKHSSQPAGFTLIEVIIVIAVVGLLISMSMPAISAARAKATAARASGNLHQLAMAQMLYAADNNQSFTPSWSPSDPVSWQLRLLPYIYPNASNGSTLRSDPKSVFNVPDAKLGSGGLTSVGLNAYAASVNTNGGRYWNFRSQLVQRPSSIILLGEIEPQNNDFVQPPDVSLGGGKPGFRRDNKTKALMAFCDGHVETLTTNQLLSTRAQPSNLWFWW